MGQWVKNLPAKQDTQVQALNQEHPLAEAMATHSCTLDWGIPWRKEPGRLQAMVLQRVRHDLVKSTYTFTKSRFELPGEDIVA